MGKRRRGERRRIGEEMEGQITKEERVGTGDKARRDTRNEREKKERRTEKRRKEKDRRTKKGKKNREENQKRGQGGEGRSE